MSDISPALRAAVVDRAMDRCEYCGLSQLGQEAVFHIDHIVPRNADGQSVLGNLALACVSCSLHKAAKQKAIDPASGELASIFNPREQKWAEHFRWDGEIAVGTSATGRATIQAMKMNRSLIVAIRKEQSLRGRHPHF
jgi:hypothetical protein